MWRRGGSQIEFRVHTTRIIGDTKARNSDSLGAGSYPGEESCEGCGTSIVAMCSSIIFSLARWEIENRRSYPRLALGMGTAPIPNTECKSEVLYAPIDELAEPRRRRCLSRIGSTFGLFAASLALVSTVSRDDRVLSLSSE
jgi:hypothetical protein